MQWSCAGGLEQPGHWQSGKSRSWPEYLPVIYYTAGIVMGSSVEMGGLLNRHTTKNAKLVLKSSRHGHVSRNLLLVLVQTSKWIKDKEEKGKGRMRCNVSLLFVLKGGQIDTRHAPCSQAAEKMFARVKWSCHVMCHLMIFLHFSLDKNMSYIADSAQPTETIHRTEDKVTHSEAFTEFRIMEKPWSLAQAMLNWCWCHWKSYVFKWIFLLVSLELWN